MFGIGFVELCVIIVVALVFVGPKKLPELMRQAGKFFVQVRRMTSDVKSTMDEVIHEAEQEIRKEEREHLTKLISNKEETQTTDLSPAGSEPSSPTDGHHQTLEANEPAQTAVSPAQPAQAPVPQQTFPIIKRKKHRKNSCNEEEESSSAGSSEESSDKPTPTSAEDSPSQNKN